jgi:hypothetical protein
VSRAGFRFGELEFQPRRRRLDLAQHFQRRRHHLRSNAVAGKDGDVKRIVGEHFIVLGLNGSGLTALRAMSLSCNHRNVDAVRAMAEGETTALLNVKEAVLVVPILASALALTYDVGYFWGIDVNLFTLFSISDHILFSIEALPLALAFSSFVIADAFLTLRGYDLAEHLVARIKSKLERPFLVFLIVFLILILITWLFYSSIFLMMLAAMAAGGWKGYWERYRPSQIVTALGAMIVALFFAFASGFDISQAYIRDAVASYVVQTGSDKMSVVLIRSGDKGVLFYDPKSKTFSFMRWDSVTRINSTP